MIQKGSIGIFWLLSNNFELLVRFWDGLRANSLLAPACPYRLSSVSRGALGLASLRRHEQSCNMRLRPLD
jgi:hypothetical protein